MPNPAQPQTVTFRGMLFNLEGTGGNCTAYVHTDENGNETLITRSDLHGVAPALGEPAHVGYHPMWKGTAPNGDEVSGTDYESGYNVPAFLPDTMTADEILHAAAGMVRALGDAAENARDAEREADYIDLAGQIWQRTAEGIADTSDDTWHRSGPDFTQHDHNETDASAVPDKCEGCSAAMTRRDKAMMLLIYAGTMLAGWLIFGEDLFKFCGMTGPC